MIIGKQEDWLRTGNRETHRVPTAAPAPLPCQETTIEQRGNVPELRVTLLGMRASRISGGNVLTDLSYSALSIPCIYLVEEASNDYL